MKYWIYKTIVNIVIYVYIFIFSITMLYIFVNWGSPFIFYFFVCVGVIMYILLSYVGYCFLHLCLLI